MTINITKEATCLTLYISGIYANYYYCYPILVDLLDWNGAWQSGMICFSTCANTEMVLSPLGFKPKYGWNCKQSVVTFQWEHRYGQRYLVKNRGTYQENKSVQFSLIHQHSCNATFTLKLYICVLGCVLWSPF